VYDELITVPVTFWAVTIDRPWIAAAGFGLHRLFDIWKPPPTRRLESLPGGWGVMADDWMAGIYSNLVLRALIWAIAALSQ
jgi:phosphatidylglycerophosphatase A